MRKWERLLLILSLAVNLALAIGLARFLREAPTTGSRRPFVTRRVPATTNVIRSVKTNVVVRAQPFSWRQIESTDYPTYIQNLRAIGCPESTVRDIIVAEVNQLFARRRATEISSTSHQWWKSDPDMDVVQAASEKIQVLDKERRALLAQLLGSSWDTGSDPYGIPATSISLDGPVLSDLTPEGRQAVRDIEQRSREKREAYARALQQEGKTLSPSELARMRRQTREELAKVLTPAQLEEYLLRYSYNADQLRESIRGFDATPEEFRGIFRAVDELDAELQVLGDAGEAASVKRRQDLEAKREEAIAKALKPERYEYYKLNRDPIFQQARDTAEEVGAPAEAVLPLYRIDQATDQERRRILNDPDLSAEEQSSELASIYEQRLESVRKLLSEEAFRKYQQSLVR